MEKMFFRNRNIVKKTPQIYHQQLFRFILIHIAGIKYTVKDGYEVSI